MIQNKHQKSTVTKKLQLIQQSFGSGFIGAEENVSHELENEGQVEGLQNDKKHQNENENDEKKKNDDEDVGVQMETCLQ